MAVIPGASWRTSPRTNPLRHDGSLLDRPHRSGTIRIRARFSTARPGGQLRLEIGAPLCQQWEESAPDAHPDGTAAAETEHQRPGPSVGWVSGLDVVAESGWCGSNGGPACRPWRWRPACRHVSAVHWERVSVATSPRGGRRLSLTVPMMPCRGRSPARPSTRTAPRRWAHTSPEPGQLLQQTVLPCGSS
jgi:hypothetical protein